MPASEPSRHMSGSDSDGVAGEEKQTGGTFVLPMLNFTVGSQTVVEETGGGLSVVSQGRSNKLQVP